MGDSKLVTGLKFAEKLSSKKSDCKRDFQELICVLMEAIQEIECCLDGHLNNIHRTRLKLCLIQLRYTINRMSEVLTGSGYVKKTVILKLLNKKIYLCLKEALNLFNDESSTTLKNHDLSYHSLIFDVLSALSSQLFPNDLNNLIDQLLCSSLTIAKLSTLTDFKEINSSCKNILNAMTSLKDKEDIKCEDENDSTHLLYEVKFLERKVNTAMLRLFLHVMCYPQGTLKKLIKKSGSISTSEKFSEDLDDEIADFDLTCDRIALIGNFAIKSCELESLKIKVQNCLANLEFCEESLVPACIDFYLEPNLEKREFLKYLSSEWKSEVLLLNSFLDSIVDPAAFSLVVFEDLYDLLHKINASDENSRETLFQNFYQRCIKLNENISKSPDCLADPFTLGLKKSLISALKENETKHSGADTSTKMKHLEIILPLVDQISEHLNKILNSTFSINSANITHFTMNDMSVKLSRQNNSSSTTHQNTSLIAREWDDRGQEKHGEDNVVPNCYLERAQMCSPFVFTMYQKTPLKRKLKDNVALTLDVSKNMGKSFDA